MAPAAGTAAARRPDVLALAARIEQDGLRAQILSRFDISYPVRRFALPAQRAAVRARLLSADPYSTAALYRMLCEVDLTEDLPRIACPVLVLAGADDGTRPPAMLAPLAQAMPNASFEVIDSGHVMPVLTPDLVAERMLAFFRLS